MNSAHKIMMVVFLSASVLSVGITGRVSARVQGEGQNDVADKRSNAAEANRELALAQAKADHKVAVEQCEALTGDARSSCKNDAGAALEVGRAQAKADKLAADPKK